LIGSFKDLRQFRITHHAFDRVIHGVTVTAEDLNGVGRDLHRHVAAKAFGHACEQVEALPVACVAGACAFVNEGAGRLDLDCHIRQHELDALELRNGLLELLTFFRVGNADIERALRQSDGLSPDGRTVEIERAH
jgi:hypothetical protein